MDLKEAYALLVFTAKLGTLAQLLPCLVFLYKYKVTFQRPWIWLFFYCALNVLLNLFALWFIDFATKHYDIIGPYLKKFNIYNTFFIEPVHYLNLIIFLGLFCLDILPNPTTKVIFRFTIIISSIFIIWNTFWGEGYENYQTVGSGIKNLIKFFYLFSLINFLYKSRLDRQIRKNPIYWVVLSLAVSILFGGLLEFISNRMYKDTEVMFYKVHIVMDWFLIISSILLSYGIYLISPQIPKRYELD